MVHPTLLTIKTRLADLFWQLVELPTLGHTGTVGGPCVTDSSGLLIISIIYRTRYRVFQGPVGSVPATELQYEFAPERQ